MICKRLGNNDLVIEPQNLLKKVARKFAESKIVTTFALAIKELPRW